MITWPLNGARIFDIDPVVFEFFEYIKESKNANLSS